MPGMNWSDPQALWLNAANIGLGIATLGCFVALGYGVVKDLLDRSRRRREAGRALAREMNAAVTNRGGDVFEVPGLGMTMADGGEPIEQTPKSAERVARKPRRRG
jgi:hypothetical protein